MLKIFGIWSNCGRLSAGRAVYFLQASLKKLQQMYNLLMMKSLWLIPNQSKITNYKFIHRSFHKCGVTLLSGPPSKTILVSAAHCNYICKVIKPILG